MTHSNLRTKVLMLSLFAVSVCYSCKTTETLLPIDDPNQNLKITGNWSLSAVKTSFLDSNGKIYYTDSTETIKGSTDYYRFIENKGFLLKDKLVKYDIIKVNNESFLVFEAYDKKNKLKISKNSPSSMYFENIEIINDKTMVQRFYFKKD
jgi:hypothetical protein